MTRNGWQALIGLGLLVSLATAAETKKPELTPPPAAEIVIVPQVAVASFGGNRFRAGHYIKSQSAWLVDIDKVDLRNEHGFDIVDLNAKGLLGNHPDGTLALWFPGFPAMVRAHTDRAVFFNEPTAAAPQLSSRSKQLIETRIWPGHDLRLTAKFGFENINHPTQLREGVIADTVGEYGAALDVPAGPGFVTLRVNSLTYKDRVANRPSSTQWSYDALYEAAVGPHWTVNGAMQWSSIRQPGLAKTELFNAGAAVTWRPLSNFSADTRLNYRKANLGPTLNSYVSKNTNGGVTFTYQPIRPVALRLGLDYSQMDRLNALQTAIDKPHEVRAFLRADYRTPGKFRAVGEWNTRRLVSSYTVAPFVQVASPLFYDAENKLDLRVSSPLANAGLAYGFYQYRERSNLAQHLIEQVNTAGAGVSYPLPHGLTVAGDLFLRTYATNQLVLSGLDADGLVAHVGLNWTISPKWSCYTDYSRAMSYYGQKTGQNWLAAGLNANLGQGKAFKVNYHRDDLSSGLTPGLDYGADVLNFSFVAPF